MWKERTVLEWHCTTRGRRASWTATQHFLFQRMRGSMGMWSDFERTMLTYQLNTMTTVRLTRLRRWVSRCRLVKSGPLRCLRKMRPHLDQCIRPSIWDLSQDKSILQMSWKMEVLELLRIVRELYQTKDLRTHTLETVPQALLFIMAQKTQKSRHLFQWPKIHKSTPYQGKSASTNLQSLLDLHRLVTKTQTMYQTKWPCANDKPFQCRDRNANLTSPSFQTYTLASLQKDTTDSHHPSIIPPPRNQVKSDQCQLF